MKSQPFNSDAVQKRNSKTPQMHSLLHPNSSLLKPNYHLNLKDLNHHADYKRIKSKNNKIKSLFREAKATNGETFLNDTKMAQKSSHRCASSERAFQGTTHKLDPASKKMKIAPTVEVCINN